jgi:hypothetical protein
LVKLVNVQNVTFLIKILDWKSHDFLQWKIYSQSFLLIEKKHTLLFWKSFKPNGKTFSFQNKSFICFVYLLNWKKTSTRTLLNFFFSFSFCSNFSPPIYIIWLHSLLVDKCLSTHEKVKKFEWKEEPWKWVGLFNSRKSGTHTHACTHLQDLITTVSTMWKTKTCIRHYKFLVNSFNF